MRQLSTDEIDDVLIRNGIGVLALVDEKQPYAIPMSFGYDGTEMLFPMQWGTGYEGRKEQCVESNANACFTVYEQDPDEPETWRSVVITGTLDEVDDDQTEQSYAILAANAEFAPELGVWGIPFERVEFRLFSLTLDECAGREFSPQSTA